MNRPRCMPGWVSALTMVVILGLPLACREGSTPPETAPESTSQEDNAKDDQGQSATTESARTGDQKRSYSSRKSRRSSRGRLVRRLFSRWRK